MKSIMRIICLRGLSVLIVCQLLMSMAVAWADFPPPPPPGCGWAWSTEDLEYCDFFGLEDCAEHTCDPEIYFGGWVFLQQEDVGCACACCWW